ncbi:hypothetical protein AAG747_11540 [Rapidithrix thailandica]|uniref:Uncharacterized protein n=1 Tax=Rapidithrix thailandica TaxID=413964 RepID=A0AAW9RUH3_9BACT
MAEKKSKSDLIFDSLKKNRDSLLYREKEKNLSFTNLDIDSIKPKKKQIEYASVKLRADLYERLRNAAKDQGIKQPGKLIALILETYLNQIEK